MADYKFRIVGKDATKKAFASIRGGLRGVRGAVNSTGVRMGLMAGAAGMGLIIKASLATIDTMAKLSDRMNISTEDLAAYHHLTQLNGESTDNFDKSLEKMTRGVGEAARGLGTSKIALEQLGISVEDIIDLDAGKQFEIIAEAISKQSNQATKASLSADIFGRAGVKLLNTINQGAEGIAQARDEVEAYGLSLSRVDAAKVEDANDQLLRVGQIAKGLGQKLTVQLAPFISVISDKFIESATEGDRMGKVVTGAIGFIVKTVGVFQDGLRGIDIIWTALKIGAQLFGAGVLLVFKSLITGAINAGQSIINFVLAPLRSGIELAAKFSDTAKEALAELDRLTTIKPPAFLETMGTALDGLNANVVKNRAELQALLLADLPSAVIEGKWQEIQAEAERRAIEVADKIREQLATASVTGEALGESDIERDARERKEQADRDRIASALLRMDEQHFTELEKIQARQQAETDIVNEALAIREIDEIEHKDRIAEIDQEASDASIALAEAEARFKRTVIVDALGQIASIQNTRSKKLFKVQKAAALAQAAVALPAAVIDSFKNAGGYPFGLIPAAAMLAAGLAEIQNIKKTKFGGGASVGGGGGAGGAGGGGPGGPSGGSAQGGFGLPAGVGDQFTQPQFNREGSQNITHINISGDVVGDDAERMIEKLKTLINESELVIIDPNSRQAQELVPTGG